MDNGLLLLCPRPRLPSFPSPPAPPRPSALMGGGGGGVGGRCSDSQQVPLIPESRSSASVRIGNARWIRADRPSILGGCPARLFSSLPQSVHFFFFCYVCII